MNSMDLVLAIRSLNYLKSFALGFCKVPARYVSSYFCILVFPLALRFVNC